MGEKLELGAPEPSGDQDRQLGEPPGNGGAVADVLAQGARPAGELGAVQPGQVGARDVAVRAGGDLLGHGALLVGHVVGVQFRHSAHGRIRPLAGG